MSDKLYVQYGCGLCAPQEWKNFDISPTLRVQKMPVIGKLFKKSLNVIFPENVHYGDIVQGLPVKDNSADGVYCSHTLEHLSLMDLKKALANTLKILKPGGVFRSVVPDLEYYSRRYIAALDKGDKMANYNFIGSPGEVLFGVEERQRGIKGLVKTMMGNSHHLWMWDYTSLADEFEKAGFKNIRRCKFNDANDKMFLAVEDSGRFSNALAVEAYK